LISGVNKGARQLQAQGGARVLTPLKKRRENKERASGGGGNTTNRKPSKTKDQIKKKNFH